MIQLGLYPAPAGTTFINTCTNDGTPLSCPSTENTENLLHALPVFPFHFKPLTHLLAVGLPAVVLAQLRVSLVPPP